MKLLDDPIDRLDNAPSGRARLLDRVWFWPTLLTLLLSLGRIWHPELWRDELRSWSAASRGLGDLFHLLGTTDAGVALYYLFLRGWITVFGDSVVAMRLPSALAMAGAAALLTLIARRLFDHRTAVVGGLVFAVIPAVSRFGQEVRPYAFTVLAACLATLLLLRAIEAPTRGRLAGYALSVTVLLLLQVVAAPLLLAHALGLGLWRRRGVVPRVGIAMAIGVALAAPVALLARSQYPHQVGALPDATIGELFTLPPRLFSSALVAGAVIILAALAPGAWRPRAFLAGWALLPIGAIWVASNLGESYWMSRYMLFTLPAFAILAAAALTALLGRRALVVAVVVLAGLGFQDQRELRWVGAHEQWTYPQGSVGAIMYSDAARIIGENARPGDAIAYAGRADFWLIDIGIAYHLGEAAPRDIFITQTAVEHGDFWPVECLVPADCLGDEVERLWVVSIDVATGDPLAVMREWEPGKAELLESEFEVEQTWYPAGLIVALLQRD